MDWIVDGFKKNVMDTITGAVASASDYIYLGGWYSVGIGVLLVCVAVRIFVPFKWAQTASGLAVAGYALFMLGMQVMFNYMRGRKKVEQPKPPPPEHVPKPDEWWKFP